MRPTMGGGQQQQQVTGNLPDITSQGGPAQHAGVAQTGSL